MVQEVRKIVLTQDELTSAFECYRRMTPDFLPDGKVIHCKPVDEATVHVTMDTATDGPAQLQKCVVKGLEVLKPLIRFCLENNIMLPKEGRKSVALFQGALVICIALTIEIDVSQYVAPMRMHHINELSPGDIPKVELPKAVNAKS